ncbi:MAG: hypothetical protein KAU10_04460, partial [Dehalococcoidia bacterium]|nr:hypothetical protein [Dehalococcoidia bacterium]
MGGYEHGVQSSLPCPSPDAEPQRHRCAVETSRYKLFVTVVRDQVEALEECRKLVEEEGIHSVL